MTVTMMSVQTTIRETIYKLEAEYKTCTNNERLREIKLDHHKLSEMLKFT